MKTFLRSLAVMGVIAVGSLGLGAKTAQAQVAIATPGFALGIGPGAGYVGGGFYPGYPIAAPLIVPRPVVVAPPLYGRPYYGGYYGRGGYYGHGGYYGRGGYGPHYRR